MRSAVLALVHTWLVLDFFAASRRTSQPGSTLTTAIFGQSFLALLLAALLYPTYPPVPFAAANLSLSTLMVAMGYLGETSRAHRHRADRNLVGTSPLRPRDLILARCLHGGFFLCLTTLGMAIPPAILLYWVAGQELWVVPAYLVLACLVSAIAAGFVAVVSHLADLFLGPARAPLLAGTLRAAILGGGFVGFALCLPHLDETRADLPMSYLAGFWPPYWAAQVLGAGSLWHLALLPASAAVLFWIAWFTEPMETRARGRIAPGGALAWLDRKLTGGGALGGLTEFTSTMLYRSPGFRLRTLPLFGLPLAMVALAFGGEVEQRRILLGMSLQFPAIYLAFLVAFLPRADQPGASWVFATSPNATLELAREASLVALTTRLLLPIQAIALLVLPLTGIGWTTAAALACYSLGVGILVAAFDLRHLEAMPFTQAEEALGTDFGGQVATALVLAALGAGFSQVADSALGVGLGVAILLVGVRRLTQGRRHGA